MSGVFESRPMVLKGFRSVVRELLYVAAEGSKSLGLGFVGLKVQAFRNTD